MNNIEHTFAQYVRTLGRGKKGSRSLTKDEAFEAMRMILNDEVEAVQLGAFLMLLRVKEESPEELAGFVAAARASLPLPDKAASIDLDWSSYAGKRRHLPWFILAALLLAENGSRILMHGTAGRRDNRIYTPNVMKLFGICNSESLEHAAQQVERDNIAFISLEHFSPKLKQIMELRSLLGLRSPINTLLRILNPLGAPHLMQGTFHPGYRTIHQQAAIHLEQAHMAVFRGEGGECERNPDGDCEVFSVHHGEANEELWPAKFKMRHLKDMTMDTKRLLQTWQGKIDDEYGIAAVIGTVAIALRMMGKTESIDDATAQAQTMWEKRDKARYPR
ncbi:MAG: glycosyl transferase family protein [Thiotrichaceae bacterium]|nr:glycosyl transferase family protein [Thiotrichaceae bacterium]PCI14399.1 MAG: glycosyl transferase [Thiotrichales bacterium]